MSSNTDPLSGNPLVPISRTSVNTPTTNLILDSDSGHSSLVVKTGTVNSLYIDRYANVGINTSSPTTQLEVASANGSCLRLRYGTSSTAYSDIFMASNGNLTIGSNSGSVNVLSSMNATNLTVSGTFSVTGGGDLNAIMAVVNPNAIGYAAAGKTLIVDNSLNITGINNIGTTTIAIGASTLNATNAGYLTSITPGTASASKALVVDSSRNILNINSLTATSLTGTLQTPAQTNITSVGTLTGLTISGATSITSTTDATNVNTGGALTVSGGAAIAKNVYVGGNLYVQGTTTSVDSTIVNIKDNAILVNASPTGPYNSGILIERYQTSNDANTGSVITDTSALTTTVVSATSTNVILSSGSLFDNFYQGWWIKINSQVRKVASYVGSTKTIVVSSAFTITPLNNDTVNLFDRPYSGVIWNETSKYFETIFTAVDSTSMTINADASLKTDTLYSNLLSSSGITSSGIINFTDTTEATTTSAASVVLSGGLGVAKAIRSGNGFYGTIQTAAQPNITSLGTLSSLIVSGNLRVGSTAAAAYPLHFGLPAMDRIISLFNTNTTSDFYGFGANSSALMYHSRTYHRWYVASLGDTLGTLVMSSSASVTNILQTTESSSTSNGALVVAGGAGIAKNVYIGGNIHIATTKTLTIGSTILTENMIGYLDGITAGTVSASKAMVVDANKSISGLASLGLSNTSPSGVVYQSMISDTYTFTHGVQGSSTVISPNSYYWNFNGAYRLFMNSSGKIATGFNTITGTTFDYDLNVNGTINATNYYWAGSLVNLARIQTPVAGTASASSALVVDASINITGINSLSSTSITIGGNQLTSTQSGYLTGLTAGTASASKAMITDASNDIIGLNTLRCTALYVNGNTVLTSGSMSLGYLTNAIVGTAMPSTTMITDANNEIVNVHAMGFSDTATTGESKISFVSDSYTLRMGLRGSTNVNGNNLAFISFNAADRILMNTSGNIGIGTNSLGTYKVNVNGSINATGFYINGSELTVSGIDIISGITNGTAAANKAMVLDGSRNIININSMTTTSITLGSNQLTSTHAGYLLLTTAGTAEASKALVLNSSRQISNIASLSTDSITINTNIISTEAAYLSGAQLGTCVASKTLVVDASKNITGVNNLSLTTLTIGSDVFNSTLLNYLTSITSGVATAGKALICSSPNKDITGLGQVGCSSLLIGGNLLTASQFTYINDLVPGVIAPNRAIVIGPNYEAAFGTTSIQFANNMFNILLSNDSSTDYAIVQRWTNTITGDDLMMDISFSNFAARWGTYSNHALRIITNNSTKMYFDTLGNIGIGNNNPGAMLDVSGSIKTQGIEMLQGSTTTTRLRLTYTPSTIYSELYCGSDGVLNISGSLATSGVISTSDITDASSTTTGSAIINGGVGIAKKLYVGGDTFIGNRLSFAGVSGDIGYDMTVIGERLWNGGATDYSEMILFKGNDASSGNSPDRIRFRSAEFRFQTFTTNETYATLGDDNNRMTILSNGNVGIGTIAPSYPLHVVGKTYITDSIISAVHSTSQASYVITNQNNNGYYGLFADGLGNTIGMRICNSTGGSPGSFAHLKVNNFVTAGYIGIGTDAPAYPLHINSSNVSKNDTYRYYRFFGASPGAYTDLTQVSSGNSINICAYFNGRLFLEDEINLKSDKRIKKNIRNLTDEYCDKLLNIEPCMYEKKKTDNTEIGFIAQDLVKQRILEVINIDEVEDKEGYLIPMEEDGVLSHEGAVYTINYIGLIPILLNLIKRNRKAKDELHDKVNSMQQQMDSMQATIKLLSDALLNSQKQ